MFDDSKRHRRQCLVAYPLPIDGLKITHNRRTQMNFLSFAFAARVKSAVAVLVTSAFLMSAVMPAYAMDALLNGALPRPLPLLPADNWWNQDIRNWPVDTNSSSYIAFI